jgi:flagellar motor switch protein FliN/FliY
MELSPRSRLMIDWLLTEWTGKLSGILESMADQKPSVERRDAAQGATAPGPDAMVWRQNFALSPDPSLWIATPSATAADLGRRTLSAAGVESSNDNDEQNTFLEILNQSLSALGQSIGAHLACEASATAGEPLKTMPAGLEWVPVRLEFADKRLDAFWLSFAPALLDRLAAGQPAEAEPATQPDAISQPVDAQPAGTRSKTFDLLLDVALPVSISFGRTFLPIKDVLKLTTGSIVELDRGVNEPVDVIVNNCVIARGEVVVVEGNYGVRILQIASRYERLRTGSATAQVQHALMGN